LKQLGVNALWLQPIHPRGIDGRQIDPGTNRPYELGSPYAVKNYFAVMPLMASGFTPGSSPAANDTPQGRAAALSSRSGTASRSLLSTGICEPPRPLWASPFSGIDQELGQAIADREATRVFWVNLHSPAER
jgi:hypothetical protein